MKKNNALSSDIFLKIFILFFMLASLGACGGGGGDTPVVAPSSQSISGGGVKGPLANAVITAYAVDTSAVDFKGSVIDTGTTNGSAQITGLALPVPLTPPYILEFTSDTGTTDITTGQSPIITTLRTVLTQALLDTGEQLYATPLTTMATDIAIANADKSAPYAGNNNGTTTPQEFLNALPVAAAQVLSTVGFGATGVDIWDTPPLIDSTTDTNPEQSAVAAYRTAVEALTAVVFNMSTTAGGGAVTAEIMFAELTSDLSDGNIDGVVAGVTSTIITANELTDLTNADPANLVIPNTNPAITVGNVEQQILVAEKTTTGSTTDTTGLEDGTITVNPVPADVDPDEDNDSVADAIDNCIAIANTGQADSNNNGVGNVCDAPPIAVADSITVNEGATVAVLDGGASNVLTNDTDAESDALTAVLDSDVSNGSLTLNANGTFSYVHNGSETTTDSFTYHASDGTSNSAIVTVSISITPQNDAPVAVVDSITVNEGATVAVLDGGATNVLTNDTDAESDALTAVLDSNVSNGGLTLNTNGTFSYVHNGSEATTDSFTYHANDGTSNSAIVTVTISITPQNDAPVATADSNSVIEDSVTNPVAGNVLSNDNDPDGPSLSVSNATALNNTGTYGTLTISAGGSYSYLLDNTNSNVNALNTGDTLTDTFNYTVSDGSLNDSANLVITITGVTDSSSGGIDISGTWVGTSTVTAVTGNVSFCDAIGTVDYEATSFTQTGSTLTAVGVNGARMTGTINPATGDFSFPLALNTPVLTFQIPDFTQPGNATAFGDTSIDVDVTGTALANGTMTGTVVATVSVDDMQLCTTTQSFSDSFVYKHKGTENYSGVYAVEISQESIVGDSTGVNTSTEQDALSLELEVTASSIILHFLPDPDPLGANTETFSAVSYDPATGFFTFTIDWTEKDDTDGDLSTIEFSSKGHEVFSGIFLRDPALGNGADGAPLMALYSNGYERDYSGDVDTGLAPFRAENFQSAAYAKRLTTNSETHTALVRRGNLTDETRIRLALKNSPLKRTSINSKLYIEVLDGSTLLCSKPYLNDGSTNGRYEDMLWLPGPSFLMFRGNNYSVVNCNTSNAGTDQVVDGNIYTIRILDTGPNGTNDGNTGDDVIAFSTTEAASVVASGERYTQAINVFDIDVNGAKSSTIASGKYVPLAGYFDSSELATVSWPAHPEGADQYQLRIEPVDEDDPEKRYRPASLTAPSILTAGLGENGVSNLRVVAIKNASNGASAQALSRRLVVIEGISGTFAVDLGNGVPAAYKTMQLILQTNFLISSCSVVGNSNLSCNAAGSSINYTTDIVSLNMTDTTGALVGTANSSFILELHFKSTGRLTSNRAVVTSPNAISGIPGSPAGATTSAVTVP